MGDEKRGRQQRRRGGRSGSRSPAGHPTRRVHAAGRPKPRPLRSQARGYQQTAQRQLQRFRQGSLLAVALTAILLLIWTSPLQLEGQQPLDAAQEMPALEPPDPAAAVDEAAATIRDLAYGFFAFLPRLVIVAALLAVTWLVSRLTDWILRRTLGGWQRAEAASALARLIVLLTAIVASLSILAGDVRTVVGSVGLLGLAASWALQTPIESFTGWLINSFQAYYRVGDRISVGEVFGDVYRIDVLTTTIWEAGGPGKPVSAPQATGALVTFPNWEILRSNIVNYSRDFPYVWDEIIVNVAQESDIAYTAQVLQATARRVLGPEMTEAAQRYQAILQERRLAFEVDEVPRVYLSLADSWTDCALRYLVPVRTRRRWSTALILAVQEEFAKAEHQGRIRPVYPRTEVVLHDRWPTSLDDGQTS